MNLFEFQAKELFRDAGIPVPRSCLVERGGDLPAALREVGCPCAVKAQVLSGKRGKQGLVRLAETEEEARSLAEGMFDSVHGVRRILIEEAVAHEEELYLSISIDPVSARALVMACRDGGIDIEELAATAPERIVRQSIDLAQGIMDYQCRSVAYEMGLNGTAAKQFSAFLAKLYAVFCSCDTELVEVNPLFVTADGGMIAGDGKVSIDENSLPRQPRFRAEREAFDSDTAYEAHLEGIPYLQFDGDISLMCAGAGLTTTVYDLINYAGGSVANYLEFGGPNYKKAVRAMELCLGNKRAKVILIVTFGTIARADVMAEGIREAIGTLKPKIPIVTCIRGTNEEEAVKILRSCGLEPMFDTELAVEKAVALAKEAGA